MSVNVTANVPPIGSSPVESSAGASSQEASFNEASGNSSKLNALLGSVKTLQAGNSRVAGLENEIIISRSATSAEAVQLQSSQPKVGNPNTINPNNKTGTVDSSVPKAFPEVRAKQITSQSTELSQPSSTSKQPLNSLSPKQFQNVKLESFQAGSFSKPGVVVDNSVGRSPQPSIGGNISRDTANLSPAALKLASLSFKLESTRSPEVIAKSLVVKDSGTPIKAEQPIITPTSQQSSTVGQKLLLQQQEENHSSTTQTKSQSQLDITPSRMLLSSASEKFDKSVIAPGTQTVSVSTKPIVKDSVLVDKEITTKKEGNGSELKPFDISSALKKKVEEDKKDLEFLAERYQGGENRGRHNQNDSEGRSQSEEEEDKQEITSKDKSTVSNLQNVNRFYVDNIESLTEEEAFRELNNIAAKIGQLIVESGGNFPPEVIEVRRVELEVVVGRLGEIIDEDRAERDLQKVKADFEEKAEYLEHLDFVGSFGIEPLNEEKRVLEPLLISDVTRGVFQRDAQGKIRYDEHGRPLLKGSIFGEPHGRAPNPFEIGPPITTEKSIQYRLAEALYRTRLDLVTSKVTGDNSSRFLLLSTLGSILSDIWSRLSNRGS